jgi:hypothetical protein
MDGIENVIPVWEAKIETTANWIIVECIKNLFHLNSHLQHFLFLYVYMLVVYNAFFFNIISFLLVFLFP